MTRKVKIAEFKSHLSEHLREVRKGTELLILDREHPIARVTPYREGRNELIVHPPKVRGGLKELKFSLHRPDIDVVKLLREDRDRR